MEIRKVLIVDDDPAITRIARFCLERIGKWQVVAASIGRDAVDFAVNEKPDLILLDVRLPDMDGPSILSKLRLQDETRNIPVILMTARVQDEEVAEYRDLDILGLISKPFDPLTLSSDIRGICSRHALAQPA
jgi:two-component system, OmpR family, response regulator